MQVHLAAGEADQYKWLTEHQQVPDLVHIHPAWFRCVQP